MLTTKVKFTKVVKIEDLPELSAVLSGDSKDSVIRLSGAHKKIAFYAVTKSSYSHATISKESFKSHNTVINVKPIVTHEFAANKRSIKVIERQLLALGGRFTISEYGVANEHLITALYENYQLSKIVAEAKVDMSESLKLFDEIGEYALDNKVSDIHFLISEEKTEIENRINGKLTTYKQLSKNMGLSLLRAVYGTLSDSDSRKDEFSEKEPQNAVVEREYTNAKVRFRYASCPEAKGMVVVLRLLVIPYADEEILSFVQLGYTESHSKIMHAALSKPKGMVAIAGTTGSGKSTTLRHSIAGIASDRTGYSVYTIEEPVEYRIPGARQIPVTREKNPKPDAPNPFAVIFRAVMRLDPQMIMVGEVRDNETAELLEQAVLSGHAVSTSVHASSALNIVSRLTSSALGMDPNAIGSINFISGLIYQCLVPVLCKHCKVPLDIDGLINSTEFYEKDRGERYKVLFSEDDIFQANETGCDNCKNTGISGQTVCAEVVMPDSKMLGFFREGDMPKAFDYWRSLRTKDINCSIGMTALEHGIIKVKQGLVSPIDVEAELDPFEV